MPYETLSQAPIEKRDKMLEATLNGDPERPLPAVVLKKKDSDPYVVSFKDVPTPRTGDNRIESRHFDVRTADQRNLGFVVLKQPQPEPGVKPYYYIGDIKITERNQGYGPATYLAVLESLPAGVGLRTEGVLSPDAIRVWENLVSKGLAQPSDKSGVPTGYETTF